MNGDAMFQWLKRRLSVWANVRQLQELVAAKQVPHSTENQ